MHDSTHPAQAGRPAHPSRDEQTKHGLWRHLHEAHGGTPGVEGHYTKPVLVEIHRGLHAKEAR